MGDSLPDPAAIEPESFALVEATRVFVEAVSATAVSAAERAAVTEALGALVARLRTDVRDPFIFVGRHSDARLENLSQAGSGRLNPQAVPLDFGPLPAPPSSGSPRPVEVEARCVLSAAHSGPPGKIHGGVAATILDEVLGAAATAAGATGLTGTLNLRYHAATPYGVPLQASARFTHSEGRKHYATGELTHDGAVTVSAVAIYVEPRG